MAKPAHNSSAPENKKAWGIARRVLFAELRWFLKSAKMSTAEPSFVPWRAQVFFIEHPLSVSFVFRYAKAWQSCSLPILVRIGVLLRRSAYGLLLYRTGSEEEAYSAPLEKRHFTVEVCRASPLVGSQANSVPGCGAL